VFGKPQGRYTGILKVSSKVQTLSNNISFCKRSESNKSQKERAQQQVFAKVASGKEKHRLRAGQQPKSAKGNIPFIQ